MLFGGAAPPNFAREIVRDGRGIAPITIGVALSEDHAKDADLMRKLASSHLMPIDWEEGTG